jgi:hypothetical protein
VIHHSRPVGREARGNATCVCGRPYIRFCHTQDHIYVSFYDPAFH